VNGFDAQPVSDQGLQGPGIPTDAVNQPVPTVHDGGAQLAEPPNPLLISPADLHHADLSGPASDASAESLKQYLSSDLVDIHIDTYHMRGGVEVPAAAHEAGGLSEAALFLTPGIAAEKPSEVLKVIDASHELLDAIREFSKDLPRDANGRFIELPESERLAREVIARLDSLLKLQGVGKLRNVLEKVAKLPGIRIAGVLKDAADAYYEEMEEPANKGRADARFRAMLAAMEKPAGEALGMAGGVELGIAALPLLEVAGPLVAVAAIAALGMAFSKVGGILLKEVTLNLENSMGAGDVNSLSLSAISGWWQQQLADVR
jgi:hypothetical protein